MWAFVCLNNGEMLDAVAQQLEKYMDLVATRQKLVAANIANVDTPGYRTKDIDFQTEFESLLPGEKPKIVNVGNLKVRNDGNDVSLDRESRMLAENDLRFRLAASLLKTNLSVVKMAIEGEKSS